MRKGILIIACLCGFEQCFCWGFYAHQKINYLAVFLLPPEMMVFYKPNLQFIQEHAIDPDKRRYLVSSEGPRHYIDIDQYGKYPYDSLPRNWSEAVEKYSEDTLISHGIVPWWILTMLQRLTKAFISKDQAKILKLSAEIGHYIADAHVPLHACHNHNGQFTNQRGIHGFWESRIPELMAEKDWDFLIGKAQFLSNPSAFIWMRVLESAVAADSVLTIEKKLSVRYSPDKKYSFEERNGKIIRQYSSEYTIAYNRLLNNMVERRMQQSIHATASFWYTAWVNAGQPDLKTLGQREFSKEDVEEFELLNRAWRDSAIKGREH